jgi:tetratricopeptide (TPR) repeat protein
MRSDAFAPHQSQRPIGPPFAPRRALDEVRGLTREQGINLIDRAAEIGLLTSRGDGFYSVHPALPWYFADLFARYYADEKADRARRAFVEAISRLGDFYHDQYNSGNSQVLGTLMAEEDNLLLAWRLAREHGCWDRVISTMQGLETLYEETGRGSAWHRVVDAVTKDFVDLHTDLPVPGREDQWKVFTGYRVGRAQNQRDFGTAERLQRLTVDRTRERASTALATEPAQRTKLQRNAIRDFAVSAHELGEIQRATKNPICADTYREAFGLFEASGDRAAQAGCAANLGAAYMDIPVLKDFTVATEWSCRSLDLRAPGDRHGRGKSLGQLGTLAFFRFREAPAKERPTEERLGLINDAVRYYQEALKLFPRTAIVERRTTHHQLGAIFGEVGDIDRALQHYRESIRYGEQAGDVFNAGQTRENAATTLLQAGRFNDARAYAEAALANFQTFGKRAADRVQKVERLLATINEAAAQDGQT